MNETILGVIFGGIVGIITTLIGHVSTNVSLKTKAKSDLALRQLEIFENTRIKAITDYCTNLMVVYDEGCITAKDYFVSAGNVLPFVSPEVRELIYKVNNHVDHWRDHPKKQLIEPEYALLISLLHQELCDSKLNPKSRKSK